jgi:putative thiamine transport system substrate-binding protein
MSPEAQARAQDPNILGYGTVLNMGALTDVDRGAFDALELGIATLSPAELGSVQAEPHPSWMIRIADDWADRYSTGQ